MNIIHNLFFTVSLAALMSGCNSEIDLVKNGTLQGREQTTIGKAIESAMGDVQWNYFETDKGVRVVELPNYLVDLNNDAWVYDPKFVFVLPSGAKPVKVALKGEMYLKRNEQAVGSEKWEAHKIMGVGVAMANNYAVITISDLQ